HRTSAVYSVRPREKPPTSSSCTGAFSMPRHCWRSRATRFWMSRWPPASERTSIFPEFFGDRWAYRPATIAPSCDGSLPFDTQLERCCTREREFITIAQLDSYSRLDLTVVH